MSEEIKLLPCPFCGGEPQFDRNYHVVVCQICSCVVDEKTDNEAIRRWNTRTTPQPPKVIKNVAIVNGHPIEIQDDFLCKTKLLNLTKNTWLPIDKWEWREESGKLIEDHYQIPNDGKLKTYFLALKAGTGA